jgi:hypothetical protein
VVRQIDVDTTLEILARRSLILPATRGVIDFDPMTAADINDLILLLKEHLSK